MQAGQQCKIQTPAVLTVSCSTHIQCMRHDAAAENTPSFCKLHWSCRYVYQLHKTFSCCAVLDPMLKQVQQVGASSAKAGLHSLCECHKCHKLQYADMQQAFHRDQHYIIHISICNLHSLPLVLCTHAIAIIKAVFTLPCRTLKVKICASTENLSQAMWLTQTMMTQIGTLRRRAVA